MHILDKIILICLFMVGAVLLPAAHPPEAEAFGFLTPFGGRVAAMVPCLAPPGAFITTVGPPRPAVVLALPNPAAYRKFGPPRPGAYILGLYSIPVVCTLTLFDYVPYPSIFISGTSGV